MGKLALVALHTLFSFPHSFFQFVLGPITAQVPTSEVVQVAQSGPGPQLARLPAH